MQRRTDRVLSWFVSVSDCDVFRLQIPGDPGPSIARRAPRNDQAPIDPTLYVTMSTAAGLAGCARQHMNREVNAGRVPAVWIDKQWIVLRSAAMTLKVGTNNRERIHPLPRIVEAPAYQQAPLQEACLPKRRRRRP
jgi:hypothetical protein